MREQRSVAQSATYGSLPKKTDGLLQSGITGRVRNGHNLVTGFNTQNFTASFSKKHEKSKP
jgi:hypothetical protein